MTEEQSNQTQEVKNDTIEINLSKQRKMYERQLEQERLARQQAEERAASLERDAQEKSASVSTNDDDDQEDDEPYVNNRKLDKKLHKFGEQTRKQTQTEIQNAVQHALNKDRQDRYLKENPDFNQIMNNEDMLERFSNKYPKLAENISGLVEKGGKTPFEVHKVVYENIKALGFDKPEQKQSSVQEKIDANRRGPSYQPSGVGTSPYATSSDFSPAGQKNAYQKMQELKNKLRL